MIIVCFTNPIALQAASDSRYLQDIAFVKT